MRRWPPGSGLTVATGVAAILAGLTISASSTGKWFNAGFAIAGVSLVATLAVLRVLAIQTDIRHKTRRRATRIVKDLISSGNRLQNHVDYQASLPTASATNYDTSTSLGCGRLMVSPGKTFNQLVEDWREVVGNKLRAAPFTSDADAFILVKSGHRLNVPLGKLREMLAELDRWIDFGD